MHRGNSKLRLVPKTTGVRKIAELTSSEEAVLERLVLGESNKEIAEQLGCSVKNVEYHVTNILRRTRMPTRLKLVARMASVR